MEHKLPIFKATHLHLKSGGHYAVIARGRIESDLTDCVVYQNVHSGDVWVRPASEFDDGRFQPFDEFKKEVRESGR